MKRAVKCVMPMLLVCMCIIVCGFCGVVAHAEDINDVYGQQQQQQQQQQQGTYNDGSGTENTSDGIHSGSVADGLIRAYDATMIDNTDMEKATRFISPYARVINGIIGAVVGLFSVLMMLMTIFDLVYLMLPPVRKFLDPTADQQQQAGGMGGMFGGGMGQQTAPTGVRFVTDEAKAALAEAQGTQQQAGGMGGMFASSGGQAQPKAKTVILLYAKKRAFALIIFFACVVLFTSTVFTDIGLRLGQWIIDTIGSAFR